MIFGSDNQAGASPQVLEALNQAYRGTASSYGSDDYCAAATDALRECFDTDLRAFFVVSGTAANTLALSTMVNPWDGILCHHQAHILLDESSAPALITGGASVLPVPAQQLKITPTDLTRMLARIPNDPPHNIHPAALSISQANECGQVYTAGELTELCAVAHAADMAVHMDGARFANAVVALDCQPADITWKAGVDALCLGATKNGAIAAEAVIFFDEALAENFDYRLKRTGHLVSKGRLFGAQFLAWLRDDHWLDLGATANAAAQELRAGVAATDGIRLAFESQSNESFIILNKRVFAQLLEAGVSLYSWYPDALPEDVPMAEDEMLARLVTSFATQQTEVTEFLDLCRRLTTT
ncbi:MAG: low specificity L-threonine aldolase [Gammaproteobacteria bacterium]|nr:low specificity L-threonine aldolase [Gammaproteobacteria bacterium]